MELMKYFQKFPDTFFVVKDVDGETLAMGRGYELANNEMMLECAKETALIDGERNIECTYLQVEA